MNYLFKCNQEYKMECQGSVAVTSSFVVEVEYQAFLMSFGVSFIIIVPCQDNFVAKVIAFLGGPLAWAKHLATTATVVINIAVATDCFLVVSGFCY